MAQDIKAVDSLYHRYLNVVHVLVAGHSIAAL